jgi:pimeloyl-ACP methyl ester carboxylesterase
MWIYRSDGGQAAIGKWCERQLAGWPMRCKRRTFDTCLGATHLLTAGESNTDTVVVVLGRHANAATALPLITALSERFRVVVPDLPGEAGLSCGGRPNTGRLRDYGAWLDELLPRVADQPVRLLGHAFGAAVVLSARPSPQVSDLVLLNPAGIKRPSPPGGLLAAGADWRLRPTTPRSRRLLSLLWAPGADPRSELVEWMRLVGRHVKGSTTPPPPPPEVSAPWRTTPCTVVLGEHDPLYPADSLAVAARRMLNARLVEVDAGHLLPYERPETVVRVLRHVGAAPVGDPHRRVVMHDAAGELRHRRARLVVGRVHPARYRCTSSRH